VIGEAVEMSKQLVPRASSANRPAVIDDVKVADSKVNDTPAVYCGDVRVLDIPFIWDGPIEDGCARRDLVDRKRDELRQPVQRLADAVAGDTATNRIQLRRELVQYASV
jgi:hypothetical protein